MSDEFRTFCRFPFAHNDVVLICQPPAGFLEILSQDLHSEVDDASVSIADEALEGVAAGVEAEAGVAVFVEGAEGLVLLYLHAQLVGYSLDGEVSEFL